MMITHCRPFVSVLLTGASGPRADVAAPHDRYPDAEQMPSADPAIGSAWAVVDGKPAPSWAALRKSR